jgi:hypothetical protein
MNAAPESSGGSPRDTTPIDAGEALVPYASQCQLPLDPPDVPDCNFCSRAAYAEYRALACANQCWLGMQNPYPVYVECRKAEQAYALKRGLCNVSTGQHWTDNSCCTGVDLLPIARAVIAGAEGVGELVGEVVAHTAKDHLKDSNNLTVCPLDTVLCIDSGCGRTNKWCVPAGGKCAAEDPDMPLLCDRTVDRFGPCADEHPCPDGQVKVYRRPEGAAVGSSGGWVCAPEDKPDKCDLLGTPPQCVQSDGSCKDCTEQNCPKGTRWDKATSSCFSCPSGQAIYIDTSTGAASCVARSTCPSGVAPSDISAGYPQCPLDCTNGLHCTWETVSLCGNPCWLCPYCNQ